MCGPVGIYSRWKVHRLGLRRKLIFHACFQIYLRSIVIYLSIYNLSIYLLSIFLSFFLSVFLSVCLSSVLQVKGHSCQFSVSSEIKIFCFINLSTSFSHSISGRPLRHLRPDDQIIFHPSVIFHARYMSILFQHIFQSFQNCVTRIFL